MSAFFLALYLASLLGYGRQAIFLSISVAFFLNGDTNINSDG